MTIIWPLLVTMLFGGEMCYATVENTTKSYTTADGLSHNSVQGFCVDNRGLLWLCSWLALESFDGYEFRSFRPDEQLQAQLKGRFKRAYLLPDNRILVALTGGQTLSFSLDDYTYTLTNEPIGSKAHRFQHQLIDRFENRWSEESVGFRLTSPAPTHYRLYKNENYPLARLFFEDSDHNMWISWGEKHGTRRPKGELSIYDPMGRLIHTRAVNSVVLSLFEDSHKNLWVGTRNDGLYLLKPNGVGGYSSYNYRHSNLPGAISNNTVFHILEDGSGRIWIATLGGGVNVVEAGFEVEQLHFALPENYPLATHPRVRSLLEVEEGLLIGTDNGLLHTKTAHPTAELVFEERLHPFEGDKPANELIHLVPSAEGRVFVSSFGKGIYLYDSKAGTFEGSVADDLAAQQAVYSLLENPDGSLWVVAQTQLLLYNSDKTEALRPIGRDYIMIETRPLRDHRGDCWFATTEGALRLLHTPKPLDEAEKLKVQFMACAFHHPDGLQSRPLSESDSLLVVPTDTRTLTLSLSALLYGRMEQVKYGWRIVEQGPQWHTLEEGNNLLLSSLASGKWTLEVRSTDGRGSWLNNIGRMRLHVEERWHEKAAVRWSAGLLLLLCGGAVMWLLWRLKKLQKMYSLLLNNQVLISLQTAITPTKSDESLTDADRAFIRLLDEKLGEQISRSDLSIEEVAASLNMSRSVFYRRLKSVVGLSPVEYIQDFRLQAAATRLKTHPEATVATIAYDCGFSSPQYFSNLFRKRYHTTPNEWRKQRPEA